MEDLGSSSSNNPHFSFSVYLNLIKYISCPICSNWFSLFFFFFLLGIHSFFSFTILRQLIFSWIYVLSSQYTHLLHTRLVFLIKLICQVMPDLDYCHCWGTLSSHMRKSPPQIYSSHCFLPTPYRTVSHCPVPSL